MSEKIDHMAEAMTAIRSVRRTLSEGTITTHGRYQIDSDLAYALDHLAQVRVTTRPSRAKGAPVAPAVLSSGPTVTEVAESLGFLTSIAGVGGR